MSFGIVFLLTHPQHAARLVVALYNLRKYYPGPITVFTTRTDGTPLVQQLLNDSRLQVNVATTIEADAGFNSTYLTKPRLLTDSPYDATLFMDADTLVVGDISVLIQATQQHPLVVTGFCNWATTHPVMRRRFEEWQPLAGQPGDVFGLSELIPLAMNYALPVINVGVFGYHRDCPTLKTWRELSDYGKDVILPDEMSLQLLLPRVPHHFLNTQYNCARAFMADAVDVRIWHFVATSHLLDDESRTIWQQAYAECCREKVAGIDTWSKIELSNTPPPIGQHH